MTAPRLAQATLAEREALFRAVFHQAADGIALTDPETLGFVEINDTACRILGYTRDELLRMGMPDVQAERDEPEARNRIDWILTRGPAGFESRHRTKDGRLMDVFVRAAAIEIAGRQLVVATWHGVTERKSLERRLRESEERLRTLIDATPDIICFKDGLGRWLHANRAKLELFGLAGTDYRGKTDSELAGLAHPCQREALLAFERTDAGARQAARMARADETIAVPGGGKRVFDVIKTPIRESGETKGLVVLGRDITDRKRAEEKLLLAASVFTSALEGIVITDASLRIADVNAAFTRITGHTREAVLGRHPRVLLTSRLDRGFLREAWHALTQGDVWRGEVRARLHDDPYAALLSIARVRDERGQTASYVGVFSDITRIKAHEAELHRIACYDTLTGLPNRRLLAERMDQAIAAAIASGTRLAVCYLDLDGFKGVNDRLGHAMGDRLLVEVARRLQTVLGPQDTLARLGGDELVLLLGGLSQDRAHCRALGSLLAAVARPIELDGTAVTITASVGVTLYPQDDGDPDTLLRHADQAMYRAKDAGKNRCECFDPARDRAARARRETRLGLERALAAGELLLLYQPRVDLASRTPIRAEALVRWRHPERGLLPPAMLLDALMGTDLEIALGEWAIRCALEQVAAWKSDGLHLGVSVNTGVRQLREPNLPERLAAILASVPGVTGTDLELEVSEEIANGDIERLVHTLSACREQGVRAVLDDFGTGYGSLTLLRALPVEGIKLDVSFVRNMLADPRDASIVAGAIGLAQGLGRTAIAVGVETPEHGTELLRLGCRLAQGYAIAPPLDPAEIPAWASAWTAPGA